MQLRFSFQAFGRGGLLASSDVFKDIYDSLLNLDRPVPGLRSLINQSAIYLQNAVDILNNLPDLQHLGIVQIYNARDLVQTRQSMDPSASPRVLESLSITWTKDTQEENFKILFSWLPHLTKLTVHDVGPEAVKTIATCIPQLEVFIDTRKPAPVRTNYEYLEDTSLDVILQYCSNLRVFDALGHRLWVRSHMLTSWACTRLEIFRCQIVDFSRLSPNEEENHRRAVAFQEQGRRLNARKVKVLERYQRDLGDHTVIYNQLARLPKLRILEVGFDHRKPRNYNSQALLRRFIDYSRPMNSTPAFSLASGLGKLSGLKELEVFGFEGSNHRIGTLELDWMAENWPKLRMLRGLEEDTLPRIRFDEQKAFLREHLRRLRPEVQHESLVILACKGNK